MHAQLTTSQIRRELIEYGAVHPGVRAVRMIAVEEYQHGETRYWSLQVPREHIRKAVQACFDSTGNPLRGQASYDAFAAALKSARN